MLEQVVIVKCGCGEELMAPELFYHRRRNGEVLCSYCVVNHQEHCELCKDGAEAA